MRGLILGRGHSLKYYKEINTNDFDVVCLVNDFNMFVRQDDQLRNFLKDISSTAYLIQQVNICCTGVDKYLLDNINIQEIISTRLQSNGENHWWREPTRAQLCGRTLCRQPESVESHMKYIENSLGVAVANMAVDRSCTEITMIGSDFYETDYYLSHKEPDWDECSSIPTQNRLKKGMDYLIGKFSNVNFTIYTCSTYTNSFENCKIIKI
tara:strand:+ start:92 stop:721 length:630 start_codon:yes stop_codon:yes gene_type:complete